MRKDSEVLIAPPSQRLVSRFATAFPGLARLLLHMSAVPDEAVVRQRSKR